MIKLKNIIQEVHEYQLGDVIVGYIDEDGHIIASDKVKGHSVLLDKHPSWGSRRTYPWRFNKIINTLFFWFDNTPESIKEMVVDYLNTKKFKVKSITTIDDFWSDDPRRKRSLYHSHGGSGTFDIYKDFAEENIKEAPIDTFQTIGDFSKGSSFTSKADRALVTHPVAVQKVKDFFKNTTANFDFYFVNTKDARKFTEVGEVKEDFIYKDLKIQPSQLKDGKINKDNITVFFTNNKGAERAPLTPWIMGHRFGHVVRNLYSWKEELSPWVERLSEYILEDYGIKKTHKWHSRGSSVNREYQIAMRHLYETIGTFKSARDKNLRDYFEFHYELFTQYLKDGSIKFNSLPDVLIVGHGSYGSKKQRRLLNRESAEENLDELSRDYHYYAENVLSDCVGKIFVM